MGIDIADTEAHQSMPLNEEKHFVMGGNRHLGQFAEKSQYFLSITQIATSQLADHHGVHQYLAILQQVA